MNFITKALAAVGTTDFNGINVATGTDLNLQEAAVKVVNWLLIISAIIAIIFLIYSGILYLTAAGNEDNAEKGKKGVINAVIGIIVITLAFVILRVINKTAQSVVS